MSFFMSGVDKRRQTLRFILDLILPRSHREFGLINGSLRAGKERGVKEKSEREREEDEWKVKTESTPVSAAGNRCCSSHFMTHVHFMGKKYAKLVDSKLDALSENEQK